MTSMFETTTFAAISSPLASATPQLLPLRTRMHSTGADVRTSPPLARSEAVSEPVTAPMPPRAKPQAPTVSSMSPM